MYDSAGDRMEKPHGYGLTDMRPQARPPRTVPNCAGCPKIPRDAEGALSAPRSGLAVELTDKNVQAYQHYLECRAVGQFPDDPVVRRNAAVIRGVEEALRPDVGEKLDFLLSVILRGR